MSCVVLLSLSLQGFPLTRVCVCVCVCVWSVCVWLSAEKRVVCVVCCWLNSLLVWMCGVVCVCVCYLWCVVFVLGWVGVCVRVCVVCASLTLGWRIALSDSSPSHGCCCCSSVSSSPSSFFWCSERERWHDFTGLGCIARLTRTNLFIAIGCVHNSTLTCYSCFCSIQWVYSMHILCMHGDLLEHIPKLQCILHYIRCIGRHFYPKRLTLHLYVLAFP